MSAIRNWSFINFPAASEISLPYTKCTPGLWQSSNLLSSFLSCSKRDVPEEKKHFLHLSSFFLSSTFLFVFLLAALRKPAGLHNLLLALSQPRVLAASKTARPRPSVMAAGRGGTTWPPLSVVHTLLSDRRCAAACSPGWSCWWAACQRAPGLSRELDWV